MCFVLDYFVKLSCKSCLFYICVSVCPFHAFVADKDWQDGLQTFGKFHALLADELAQCFISFFFLTSRFFSVILAVTSSF